MPKFTEIQASHSEAMTREEDLWHILSARCGGGVGGERESIDRYIYR